MVFPIYHYIRRINRFKVVIGEDKDIFILDDEEELDGTELVVVKSEMYRVTGSVNLNVYSL